MSDQAIKSFTTSAKERDPDKDEVVIFELDGRTFTARPPQGTQFVLLAAMGKEDFGSQVREMGHFIDACLPAKQRGILADRLRDPDDPFEIDDLTNIFRYLIGEFTGRPTESSTD